MSASYTAVSWNRQKKLYDWVIFLCCSIYLVVFVATTAIVNPDYTFETLLIRSTSTLALLLLHIILSIGPLTRINRKFLPLLYNRRHLGVTMFAIVLVHGCFSIFQFHALGNTHPLVSLFSSNTRYNSISQFPFQAPGFFALFIFFLMAITSHDFWLHNLSPRVWKALHMLVYLAYLLVILHVMLGVIQYETNPALVILLAAGAAWLIILHLAAGGKEVKKDNRVYPPGHDGYSYVCETQEILPGRAKIFCVGKERVAIYNFENRLYAIHNVCRHQGGPLGEGKIIDGCITCPWHGYQYYPHNGQSPPPFKERVNTYDIRVIGTKLLLNPTPFAAGTEKPGVDINQKQDSSATAINKETIPAGENEFYTGWMSKAPKGFAKHTRNTILAIMATAIIVGLLTAISQKKSGTAIFESGTLTELTGVYFARPVPCIKVISEKDILGRHTYITVPLVGFGKHGADAVMENIEKEKNIPLNQAVITLKGTLLYNDGKLLMQVDSNDHPLKSIGGKAGASLLPSVQDMGIQTVKGEIIDPKCFFGVMKPGQGKPHKDCAIRCILGGVAPILRVINQSGAANYYLIAGAEGEKMNEAVKDFVAEPVAVTARVAKYDDWIVLYVNKNGISRISGASLFRHDAVPIACMGIKQ